jgi:hypothetical protein
MRAELAGDIDGVLTWVISDVCSESSVKSIEVLMFPGPTGLEFVLHPRPRTQDGRSRTQSKLDKFNKELYKRPLEKLKQAVTRRYPSTVTAEIGTLDFEPIGVSPTTTTRLYSIKDGNRIPCGNIRGDPLEDLFTVLQDGDNPFIYQVIVSGGDGSYTVSVRLATYRPVTNYTGDRGFAKLVNQEHPVDLERVFGPWNLVSNHDAALADPYWWTHYRGPGTYDVDYNYQTRNQYNTREQVRQRAERIKDIVLGHKEHQRLLNGDTTYDPLLREKFDRYGRFSLAEAELKPFVQTVTQPWETNPWQAVEGRSAPEFFTRESLEIESESDFGPGRDTRTRPQDRSGVVNEGSPGHSALEAYTQQVFTEGGDDIERVEQTTESLPDGRIRTEDGEIETLGTTVDSEVVAVECEHTNSTKPSSTLVNAERAFGADRHVIFVYNQSDVERGYGHLKQPFKSKCADGVELYNGTEYVDDPDGRTLVRAGNGNTTYILSNDTLIVRDDEGELTRGPATDDVGTFQWGPDTLQTRSTATSDTETEPGDATRGTGELSSGSDSSIDSGVDTDTSCGYYRETDDGTHRVETGDGECIAEYASKGAFAADWTLLREPHIPVAFSYLDFVTVAYRDAETNQLQVYDPRPEWETAEKTDSQQAGFEVFDEQFIVEREGAEIKYDKLEEQFTTWFEGISGYQAPVRSILGKYLPEELQEAKKGSTDNEFRFFEGYDWVFQPGLDSPHQPDPPADIPPANPDIDEPTDDDSETAA